MALLYQHDDFMILLKAQLQSHHIVVVQIQSTCGISVSDHEGDDRSPWTPRLRLTQDFNTLASNHVLFKQKGPVTGVPSIISYCLAIVYHLSYWFYHIMVTGITTISYCLPVVIGVVSNPCINQPMGKGHLLYSSGFHSVHFNRPTEGNHMVKRSPETYLDKVA